MLSSGRKFAGGLGVWSHGRAVVAATVALLLLPIEVSNAGWLSDMFKGSSKQAQPPKRTAPAKPKVSSKPARVAKPATPPKQRAATAETVNADAKQHRGLRGFGVRGLGKALGSASLFVVTYDILRLIALDG